MTDTEKKMTKPRKPRTTAVKAAESKATVPNKSAARSKVMQMKASHEEIARLAHRFWTERGRQHGHDTEDWLRAERQLLGKAS
jgi:Protein of unknown function (DUF2934)